MHNNGSTNDTPTSKYEGTGIDHYAVATKTTDRDEIVSPEMITKTSVIDHRNLISLTHSSYNSSPTVSDSQAFSNIIIPPSQLDLLMKAISKPQNNLDNLKSFDMDLSDDDQKHPVPLLPPLLPPVPPPMLTLTIPPLPSPMKPPTPQSMSTSTQPPLPPPMKLPPHPFVPTSTLPPLPPPMPTSTPLPFILPFNLVQQSIPNVKYHLEQSLQPWKKYRPSFNKIHLNIEHPSQCYSTFVSNQPQIQWPIHVQGIKSKEDFTPKWKGRRISNWPSRDPRIYNRNSRPAATFNQGSRIGPEESALVSELF